MFDRAAYLGHDFRFVAQNDWVVAWAVDLVQLRMTNSEANCLTTTCSAPGSGSSMLSILSSELCCGSTTTRAVVVIVPLLFLFLHHPRA